MLIDYCRSCNCTVRKIIDGKEDGNLSDKRIQALDGTTCANCKAWQYELWRLENEQ